MARRSDHTRDELTQMTVMAGQRLIAEGGLSHFSARKVAKEIGYTIGTVYNVFGSHDMLMLRINAVTLDDIAHYIQKNCDSTHPAKEQIQQLATAYLTFATEHYGRWSALFDYRLSHETAPPAWYSDKIRALFSFIEKPLLEVTHDPQQAQHAAKSIWAGIHGVCTLGLTGKLDVVGADSMQLLIENLVHHYYDGLSTSIHS